MIRLQLTHDVDSLPASRRTFHKLGVGVPFYDVGPPTGVETVACESVRLDMTVSREGKAKRRRLFEEIPICRSLSLRNDSNSTFDDLDPDELLLDAELVRDISSTSQDPLSTTELGSVLELGHYSACEREKPSLKRTQLDTSMSEQDGPWILQMIDVALRGAICGSLARIDRSFLMDATGYHLPLAAIAPSIWSPGYHPSIADRAIFLPTINHAIDSLQRRCSSRGQSHQRHEKPGHSAVTSSPYSPDHTLSLWSLLQRGLTDPRAAHDLPPLQTFVVGNTAADSLHNLLLQPQVDHSFGLDLQEEEDEELLDESDYFDRAPYADEDRSTPLDLDDPASFDNLSDLLGDAELGGHDLEYFADDGEDKDDALGATPSPDCYKPAQTVQHDDEISQYNLRPCVDEADEILSLTDGVDCSSGEEMLDERPANEAVHGLETVEMFV